METKSYCTLPTRTLSGVLRISVDGDNLLRAQITAGGGGGGGGMGALGCYSEKKKKIGRP